MVGPGAYAAEYDANGNMASRVVDGQAQVLEWDAENRLVRVRQGASVSTFLYDGDGNRVRATVDGVTTVYIGNYYEQSGSAIRTYCYHAGQRVAMREGGVTTWLFGDHLGSTSVAYRGSDGQTTRQLYYAWGTARPGPGNALPTDHTFTGQKLDARSGLMYYVARWYDPQVGRFLSPDSIVPEPGEPQGLNRYTYAGNNPCLYVDPTGHVWWIPVGAAVGAVVGAGIGYGAQVAANLGRGMHLRQALTTDIDASKIVGGAFLGAMAGTAIATGVGLVATGGVAVGTGATGAGAATGLATAALSDDGGAGEIRAVQSAYQQVLTQARQMADAATQGCLRSGGIVSLGHSKPIEGLPAYDAWGAAQVQAGRSVAWFKLPEATWEALQDGAKHLRWDPVWEVNKAFLNKAMEYGVRFHLQLPDPRVGTYFWREIQYLKEFGYHMFFDGGEWWMIRSLEYVDG